VCASSSLSIHKHTHPSIAPIAHVAPGCPMRCVMTCCPRDAFGRQTVKPKLVEKKKSVKGKTTIVREPKKDQQSCIKDLNSFFKDRAYLPAKGALKSLKSLKEP
jgi:hypothetical protein